MNNNFAYQWGSFPPGPPPTVVPGRLELPTSTLSVWRSNQLSYRTGVKSAGQHRKPSIISPSVYYKTDTRRVQGKTETTGPVTGGKCRLNMPAGKRQGTISRKEVFQPHLPVRLPCYDLAPITCFTLGRPSRSRTSGAPGFHGLTGGVYKARERIHRAMADARLLANPASWGRVADPSPN